MRKKILTNGEKTIIINVACSLMNKEFSCFLDKNLSGVDILNIAVLGAGNMATAIIRGILNNGFVNQSEVFVSDKNAAARERVAALGVHTYEENLKAAECGELILIAVKPNVVPVVLEELRRLQGIENKVIVSIAAGVTMDCLSKGLEGKAKVVRVMPNTPAMVGEGMSAICRNPLLSTEETEQVLALFSTLGKAILVDEKQIDAVTAVSGSGPAYVYMIIEAMADGGVLCGLPRETAYTLAAQTVLGSAKMVLESGEHPGALKDKVCSPGGTTIEAVYALEQAGLRPAMIDAVKRCAEKSSAMRM